MRTKCRECGTALKDRNSQDMGICLTCYNIENSDFDEEPEGMRVPVKAKKLDKKNGRLPNPPQQ